MTSPISAHPRQQKSTGFTLVELLVVIGVIALILGLLLPTVSLVRRKAARAKLLGDLQAISLGLDAYKADFGDYPRAEGYNAGNWAADNSSQILCRALYGHMPAIDLGTPPNSPGDPLVPGHVVGIGQTYWRDGNDGPGFRVSEAVDTTTGMRRLATQANLATDQPQGRVYGPYINVNNFGADDLNLSAQSTLTAYTNRNYLRYTLLDAPKVAALRSIIYWPAKKTKPNLTVTDSTPTDYDGYYLGFSPSSWYDLNDVMHDDILNWPVLTPVDDSTRRPMCRPAETASVNKAKVSAVNKIVMRIRILFGDTNMNGGIDNGESPRITGNYILWAAGEDRWFGPMQKSDPSDPTKLADPTADDVRKCDDVLYGVEN